MKATTSRRAMLAGLSIVPLVALNASASQAEPDPVFAAIEAHRVARAAYWTPVPGETDQEIDDRLDRTGAPADDALMDFLETIPTTVAGCIAALRHLNEHLAKYEDGEGNILGNCTAPLSDFGAVFLDAIADALDAAAVRS